MSRDVNLHLSFSAILPVFLWLFSVHVVRRILSLSAGRRQSNITMNVGDLA